MDIGLGSAHTCMLNVLSKLWCWGRNQYGVLGFGDNVDYYHSPKKVELYEDAAQLFAAYFNTCIIDVLSRLYCWGWNINGQLGLGLDDNIIRDTPTLVTLVNDPAQVAIGQFHMCVLDVRSKLWCSGNNNFGQLGIGNTVDQNEPTQVIIPQGGWVTQVRAGYQHTCFVDNLSELWCFGNNDYFQLGLGEHNGNNDRHTPTKVDSLNVGVSQLSLGKRQTCIIDVTGIGLYCWGYVTSEVKSSPTQIKIKLVSAGAGVPYSFAQISTSSLHNCVLGVDKKLFCWGLNNGGLGLGDGFESGMYFSPSIVRGL